MKLYLKEYLTLFIAAFLALFSSLLANKLIGRYTTDTMDENNRIAALKKFRLRQLKAILIIIAAFCIGYALSYTQTKIPWKTLIPTLLIIFPYFAQGGHEIQTWGEKSAQEKIDKIWNWTISFIGIVWLIINILTGIN